MSDEIRKALAANPGLQKRMEAFLAIRTTFPRLYDVACAQPVPQRLIDIVMSARALPSGPRSR